MNWSEIGGDQSSVGVSGFLNDAGYLSSVNWSEGTMTNMTGINWSSFLINETDPIYSASSWATTVNNANTWDTAYGWGNHATQGYIKGVNWTDIGGLQSDINVSGFTNDAGYITTGDVPDTGWTKSGFNVYLTNSSDSVGLGKTNPSERLDVDGNIKAGKAFLSADMNDSSLRVGSFEFQNYGLNNSWFGDNVYYSEGFKYRADGAGGIFYFQGQEGQFRFFPTGYAGEKI